MESIRADEYCKFVTDGTHDSPKSIENGRKLITSKHLKRYGIDFNSAKCISDVDYNKIINRSKVEQWDILISMIGTVGNVYLERNEVIDYACKNIGIFQLDGDEMKAKWLYYYLQSPTAKAYIETSCRGTTQSYIPLNALRALPIAVVSDSVRDKIVNFLWCIDEKILTNFRINKNLEEQIAAILLKTIDNTDSQPVRLGDYLYIKGRIGWKGLKKSEYLPSSNYRIINGESLTQSGIDWNKAGYISRKRYEESPEIMLNIGDILLSKDGTIGKIGYVNKLELPTSVASGIFVIRNTKEDRISTQFIYYLLKSQLFKAFIVSRTEGSVIPHLYQKDFMEFKFRLPSCNDMKIFDNTTAAMFSMVFLNLNENERLIHLRNSLLPKLMSEKLDISSCGL